YENKDDEYSNKAGKLYFKYTNTWESTVEEVKDFGITGIDLGKGLVNLAGDVLKGGYGLVKGAVVIAGAGVAMKSMMETGDAPDCLKKCITETKGYGKTVSSVLKDPVILAEGMAQSASDTVEEKGIAYSTSYVLGGVLLTKGLSKVSSVSKVGEVASKGDGLYTELNKIKDPDKVYKYLSDKSKTMDISTEKNKSIFYAGQIETTSGTLKARKLAESYADQLYKDKGVVKLTLERTDGWKWMDGLQLYQNTPSGLKKYEKLGLTKEQTDDIWSTLPSRYADGTSGSVTAFTKNVPDEFKSKTIFWTTELPQLRNNAKVAHINIR
ncbi:hypothetical protein, partial [Clostridium frigoriphilum]